MNNLPRDFIAIAEERDRLREEVSQLRNDLTAYQLERDAAQRKLNFENREPPHCPTCDCGSRVPQPCTHDDPSWCDAKCERWREWVKARRSSEPQEVTMDPTTNCGNCHVCLHGEFDKTTGMPLSAMRMIVCPTCGNKRCPKATDHENACTGSNDIGQGGSIYGGLPIHPRALTTER